MSYPIAPYPAMRDPNIQIAVRALRPEHVQAIRALGDEYLAKWGHPGKVGFHETKREDSSKRVVTAVWLSWPKEDPRTEPIYNSVGHICQEANAHFWQYDLWGFQDNLHYTHYDVGGHFAWHQDRGDDWRRMQRKLSVTVLLSEPDEYEGGEFETFDGQPRPVMERSAGSVFIFPSFVQHRVKPVTKGNRRVLIGWLGGPRFR